MRTRMQVVSVTVFESHAGMGKRRSGFNHTYIVDDSGRYTRTLRNLYNEVQQADRAAPYAVSCTVPAARAQLGSAMRGPRARRTAVPAILKPRGEAVSAERETLQRNDQQVMWEMEVEGLPFSDDDIGTDSGADRAAWSPQREGCCAAAGVRARPSRAPAGWPVLAPGMLSTHMHAGADCNSERCSPTSL